ncbi:conserved hypothetical protein [uncultured Gammaproteobacteria bacterium]
MKPASTTAQSTAVEVNEIGSQNFILAVMFGGRRFECGSYISRAAALQAGRLFVQRKEAETVGQQGRSRRKPKG